MKIWHIVLLILILLGAGVFYFFTKGALVVTETLNYAEMKASDAVLKSTSQQVLAAAEIYKNTDERNHYGISSTENFCTSKEVNMVQILDFLKKSSPFSECLTSPSYPATSFTLIAEANETSGYFCTDSNGYAGIIPDLASIKKGVSCK